MRILYHALRLRTTGLCRGGMVAGRWNMYGAALTSHSAHSFQILAREAFSFPSNPTLNHGAHFTLQISMIRLTASCATKTLPIALLQKACIAHNTTSCCGLRWVDVHGDGLRLSGWSHCQCTRFTNVFQPRAVYGGGVDAMGVRGRGRRMCHIVNSHHCAGMSGMR